MVMVRVKLGTWIGPTSISGTLMSWQMVFKLVARSSCGPPSFLGCVAFTAFTTHAGTHDLLKASVMSQ
eukprot:7229030-Alexandrium_andersonii.AAC.1